jgi:hypothetical protein
MQGGSHSPCSRFIRHKDTTPGRWATLANIGKVPGGNAIGSTARKAISNQRQGPISGSRVRRESDGTTNACAL